MDVRLSLMPHGTRETLGASTPRLRARTPFCQHFEPQMDADERGLGKVDSHEGTKGTKVFYPQMDTDERRC